MSFDGLIAKAMRIGVDEIAYPIDVFATATELAEHPQAAENFDRLLGLVEDGENHFTRWAAIRAIGQMDHEFLLLAKDSLERQSMVEDYALARSEIKACLDRLG